MSEHRATVDWQRSWISAHEKCFIANSVKTEVTVEPC
jgi:organic hydroperoxide reductase OsmC/OhrA